MLTRTKEKFLDENSTLKLKAYKLFYVNNRLNFSIET